MRPHMLRHMTARVTPPSWESVGSNVLNCDTRLLEPDRVSFLVLETELINVKNTIHPAT